MPLPSQRPDSDADLLHREKGVLRSTFVVLATLFTLILFAFTTPRAETALAWAVDLMATLAA